MDELVPKSIAEQHFIGKCEAEAKAARYKELAEDSIPRELVKAIAEEIGKQTVAYVEVMYPEAIKATTSTFKLSLRNHIYNEIMSMVDLHDEMSIRANLFTKAAFRKAWVKQYRKMRRAKGTS